ncbi:MAG: GNAT family N-acetyltransferase [Cyanobacteria bacterium J06639_16]
MVLKQFTLPPNCQLRRAAASDRAAIFKLVLGAFLDPTQLRWQQFWLITHEDQAIACGQLRQFEGAQELGSVVVASDWRGKGLGTLMTGHLIGQATAPLYLECVGRGLAEFYRRLGFEAADWAAMPSGIKGKFRLSHWAATMLRVPIFVLRYGERG